MSGIGKQSSRSHTKIFRSTLNTCFNVGLLTNLGPCCAIYVRPPCFGSLYSIRLDAFRAVLDCYVVKSDHNIFCMQQIFDQISNLIAFKGSKLLVYNNNGLVNIHPSVTKEGIRVHCMVIWISESQFLPEFAHCATHFPTKNLVTFCLRNFFKTKQEHRFLPL